MRLTLRTLLAYLDDTLEAGQAKGMGRKVAESEFAQETVERIKTVTRRRRLSAPPIEAHESAADPNTIAEYLDNVLQDDQLAEVERAALDSDVLLAEVAACHQILTLVLGEPAKVPPTARARMYGLVKGPEALSYRKPTTSGPPVAGVTPPAEADDFADDDLLDAVLGTQKVLWFVGILSLIAMLIVAVWLAIPAPPPPQVHGYTTLPVTPRVESKTAPPAPAPKVPGEKLPPDPEEKKDPPAKDPEPVIELAPVPRVVAAPPALPPVKEPDTERRLVGSFDTPAQPLLYRRRDTDKWERANPGEPRLATADSLLALPGFHPEVKLDSGVRVQLWGNLPEFLNVPVDEAEVTLHLPPQGMAADLTLHAGRLFLTAPRAAGTVAVRVRFLEEVWDIVLTDQMTEVAIDLYGEPVRGPLFDRDIVESPRTLVYLGVLSGSAFLRTGQLPPAKVGAGDRWKWDSKGGQAGPVPKVDADEAVLIDRWARRVPVTAAAKETTAAVNEMLRRLTIGQGPFTADFDLTIRDTHEPVARRVVSVWMLEGLGGTAALIEALEADVAAVREAAGRALRHRIARDASEEGEFLRVLSGKAAFNEDQRSLIMTLLRLPEKAPPPDTYEKLFGLLRNDKLAIRELARGQLAHLDPTGAEESAYDAGAAADRREMQATTWQRSWAKRWR